MILSKNRQRIIFVLSHLLQVAARVSMAVYSPKTVTRILLKFWRQTIMNCSKGLRHRKQRKRKLVAFLKWNASSLECRIAGLSKDSDDKYPQAETRLLSSIKTKWTLNVEICPMYTLLRYI
jgi:hypothetical protein